MTVRAYLGLPQALKVDNVRQARTTGGSQETLIRQGRAPLGQIPYRIGTLPNTLVGGVAEFPTPFGRSVDAGYAPKGVPGNRFARAAGGTPLQGQGHYSAVPTWNNRTAAGPGTSSGHAKALRQGVMTGLFSYSPPSENSSLSFLAKLTRTRLANGGGINNIQGRA